MYLSRLIILLAASLWSLAAFAAQDKPNVLLILSDDHSYPFLSCYGSPNVKTPTLDGLAAQGLRLNRFYTNAPQCVPSRAAFMTGRSPVAARMGRFTSPLPRDEITFPELMRQKAGYFVGVGGRSFHLNGRTNGSQYAKLYEEHRLETFSDRFDFVQSKLDRTAPAQPLAEFLDKKPADKPFFFWMNFSDPHHPWDAPAELTPDPQSLKLEGHFADLPGVREEFARYCGEINHLDADIAQVLAELAKRGHEQNTLVIFAGDNGAALWRGKGSLHDLGCHVPCLMRWPGVIQPGSVTDALTQGEDIGPTVLEAVGLSPGEKMSGHSLCPLLRGRPFTPRTYVFTQRVMHGDPQISPDMGSNGYDIARAITSERYRLIYTAVPWLPYVPVDISAGAGWSQMKAAHEKRELPAAIDAAFFTHPRPVFQLFDLKEDPSELNNLAGKPEYRKVEDELRQALSERMILDFDYVPLPAVAQDKKHPKQKTKAR